MPTGAIRSATDNTAALNSGFASLTSDQFIKVLVTELTHQDPFQPQDSSKVLEQLSSLRNIESQMALQEKLGALVDNNANGQQSLLESLQTLIMQNQLTAAGAMIGKKVQGVTVGTGGKIETVSGLVTSVRVQEGKVILDLDTGKALPMDQITLVAGAEAAETIQTASRAEELLSDTAGAGETVQTASQAEQLLSDLAEAAAQQTN